MLLVRVMLSIQRYRNNENRREIIDRANINQNKVSTVMSLSDKIEVKIGNVTRAKEGY